MPSTAIIRVISEVNTTSINGVITQVQTLNKVLQDTRTSTTTATTSFLDMTRALGQVGSAIRQVGQGLMNMGMTLTIATAPLALMGKEGLEAAAKFGQTEAALKAVTTTAEGGASAVSEVGQNILSAAKNFTFGANEMLFTTLMLKEAGFNLETSQLAAVAGANLTTAAYDGAERTTEAYKTATMDLAKATRMFNPALLATAQITKDYIPVQTELNTNADIFSAVLNTSSARMDEFIQGFNYLAPVTAAMGLSLKDTAIAIGMVSDKGIDGSRAGREMASAFLKMSSNAPVVQEAMKALGVSLFDVNGNTRDMRSIIEDLNTALFGIGIPAKAATADIQTLGSKAVEASEKVTVAQAKFASDQLLNAKKIADFMASTKGASQAQADAYKLAQSAIQGDVAAVEKQTLALMNNKGAWDKLSPAMRTQIQAMYRDANATLKSQDAYNKLIGTSNKLITTNGKLTDAERIRYAGILFGNAGVRAMIPLVQGGTDAWDKYTTAIENSGTAEEIAQRKLDNFKDSMDKLRVAVESAMIRAFGPIIDKYLTPLVQKLQEAVAWFDNLSQPVKEIIVLMAALLVAAGPILFMFGSLLFTVGMFTQGFAGLATVIFSAVLPNLGLLLAIGAPILGMFALLGLGIAGVATALITNSNGIRDQMAGPFKTILGYFSDLKAWLDDKIPKAIDALKGFLTSLGTAFLSNIKWDEIFKQVDTLRTAFGELFKAIFGGGAAGEPLGGNTPAEMKGAQGNKGLIQKSQLQIDAENFGGGIGKVLADLVNNIIPAFIGKIVEITKNLATELPKWKALLDTHLPALIDSLSRLAEAISGVYTAFGKINNEKQPAVLADLLKILVGIGMDALSLMINNLAYALEHLASAIDSLQKKDLAGFARDFSKSFSSLIVPFSGQIGEGGVDLGKQIREAIGGESIDKVVNTMLGFGIEPIGAGIRKALEGVVSVFQWLSDTLVGKSIVPDMINSIISWFETLGVRLPEIVTTALLGTKGKGGVLGSITEALLPLKTAWDNIFLQLQTSWSGFWDGLAGYVTKILVGEKGKGGVTGAIRDTFEEFAKVGSALVDSIAKGIQDATENMVNSLVDAVKSAMRAAERAMAGWSPGTGGGGGSSGFGGGMASGGNAYAGQSYLVGERGPELFSPSMSGSIVPNNMLPAFAFAGNSSRQINYNLTYQHAGGEMIPQSEITHLLEMIETQATLRPS